MIWLLSISLGISLWLRPWAAALWSLIQILLVITFAKFSSSLIAGISNSSIRMSLIPYNLTALVFMVILLIQHDLSTGDRYCLSSFVGLFDYVNDRLHHIHCCAAAIHRHLSFIGPSHVFNRFS